MLRQKITVIILILLSFLLSGCLGGGGGGDSTSETSTDTSASTTVLIGASLRLLPDSSTATTSVILTALLKDGNNAPLAGQTISFSFVDNNSETLSPTTATTNENGLAQVTVTDLEANGGAVIVKATAGELIAYATITFQTALDEISDLQITASNDFAHADGVDAIVVAVVVRDSAGIPLSGITVSLKSDSDAPAFEAVRGVTNDKGQFSTKVTSTVAEPITVTASVVGKQEVTQVITFVAPESTLELTADQNVLAVGEKAAVTVKIVDKIFTSSERAVQTTFIANVSGSAQVLNKPELTDGNGLATFEVTDSVAEEVTVTVISGTASATLKLYFGATLTLLPAKTNAIGQTTLTALLKTGSGTPLVGQPIAFSLVQSTNETLTPASALSGENGTVGITVSDLGADGGQITVNAQSGSLTAQAVVNFLTDLGQGRQLEVTSSAKILQTNQSATITAIIKDEVGLPVVGQTVSFSATEETSHAQIKPTNEATDADGKVKATVSNTVAENVVIRVTAGTASQEIPLYFGATLSLTPPQTSGVVDGEDPVALAVNLKDANQQGIAGVTVNLRVTSGEGLLNVFQPVTNESGQAFVTVASKVAGPTVIEAQTNTLTASSTIDFTQTESLQRIELETIPANPIVLSLNGQATIIATVWDEKGFLVKDGTVVNFNATTGAITNQVLTREGKADAIFEAGTKAGVAEITVTSGDLVKTVSIQVESGKSAGIIEVHSIDPPIIGVAGSGILQTSTVQFLVKDDLGNTVADGTLVQFSLGTTTLGGGETISTGESGNATQVSARTRNGVVSVVLKSGLVAGSVDIIAKIGEVSTVARVTIVSSTPDTEHFSLAVEYLNVAGGVRFGLLDTVTAYVGDRFGNIVPDGTPVSFITEGGTIGKSVSSGAFTSTTEFGQATAILQSAEPMTPRLGGVPALSTTGTGTFFECDFPYQPAVDTLTVQYGCGNPGWTTIVAYTTGSESFMDVNGNGRFDAETDKFHSGYYDTNLNQRWDMNEIITGEGDLSEPYIDGNDNNTFDPGELYVDVNSNGQFDGPDGQFQSNTTIWRSARVLFSAQTAEFRVTSDEPIPFTIYNGDNQIFTVDGVSDIYGNALVGGSRFSVKTTSGVLDDTIDILFTDNIGRGHFTTQFILASNPPSETGVYPPPTSVLLTIEITSPDSDTASGGNGGKEIIISGKINVEN